jgi:hypothetical protein
VHAEFQAQTIIHEASHLTHCTEDKTGRTIGVAECLAQFVAATNGSPLDPRFTDRCSASNRCAPAVATKPSVSPRFGAVGNRPPQIRGVIFRPQDAVFPKARPGARR